MGVKVRTAFRELGGASKMSTVQEEFVLPVKSVIVGRQRGTQADVVGGTEGEGQKVGGPSRRLQLDQYRGNGPYNGSGGWAMNASNSCI